MRVPLYIRGPGVPRGVKLPHLISNIDFAPTWLELAGELLRSRLSQQGVGLWQPACWRVVAGTVHFVDGVAGRLGPGSMRCSQPAGTAAAANQPARPLQPNRPVLASAMNYQLQHCDHSFRPAQPSPAHSALHIKCRRAGSVGRVAGWQVICSRAAEQDGTCRPRLLPHWGANREAE